MRTTLHYNLPLFNADDKPSFLMDWNSAMSKLDTALFTIATGGDTSVVDAIDTLNNQMSSVNDIINSISNTQETGRLDIVEDEINGLKNEISNINTGLPFNIQFNNLYNNFALSLPLNTSIQYYLSNLTNILINNGYNRYEKRLYFGVKIKDSTNWNISYSSNTLYDSVEVSLKTSDFDNIYKETIGASDEPYNILSDDISIGEMLPNLPNCDEIIMVPISRNYFTLLVTNNSDYDACVFSNNDIIDVLKILKPSDFDPNYMQPYNYITANEFTTTYSARSNETILGTSYKMYINTTEKITKDTVLQRLHPYPMGELSIKLGTIKKTRYNQELNITFPYSINSQYYGVDFVVFYK